VTGRTRPEQDLQRSVSDHLQWRGVLKLFWCHYPAGGHRSPIEAKIFRSLGVVPGVPDLLLVQSSEPFALELKSEHGRLTPIQIETQDRMRVAGVTVATVAGIDAALKQLSEWELLR